MPARSEFQEPGDELNFRGERMRRAGFLGRTFAETWRLWLERGAEVKQAEGVIEIEMPGAHITRIPLPWVEWDDVLRLFERPATLESVGAVPEEMPAEVALTRVAVSTTTKPKASTERLETWYKDRVENWPLGQNPPSEDDDWNAAVAKFPESSVTRAQIRDVRSRLAPSAWTAKGRRPDFQNPNKLAEKLAIKPAGKPAKK
jgi:hypothetical protein